MSKENISAAEGSGKTRWLSELPLGTTFWVMVNSKRELCHLLSKLNSTQSNEKPVYCLVLRGEKVVFSRIEDGQVEVVSYDKEYWEAEKTLYSMEQAQRRKR